MEMDFEKDIGKTIALAGLLHDIGKFMNRTSERFRDVEKKAHPFLSKEFVKAMESEKIIAENNLLKTLVQRHHEHTLMEDDLLVQKIEDENIRKLAYIVSKADNYSSSERENIKDENRGKYKTNALHNIFQTVFNDDANESYLLKEFSPKDGNIFSVEKDVLVSNSYDAYYGKFGEEFKKIAKSNNFNELFTKLYYLFEKYLWCVPSDTREKNRIVSLFDHLKTTSAIALANYRYHLGINDFSLKKIKDGSEKKFILIGGDISGIQNYIYGIQSTKKIAKRLRARSFNIRLLTDVVSHKILNELELTIANNVISAGGKFFILADNSEKTKKKLGEIREEINSWLYEDYQAELFFNLDWIEVAGDEFANFNIIYDEINNKLDENKGKKYEKFILENPVIEKNYKGTHLCEICRKYWKKPEKESCQKCSDDEKMGQWLTKTKYLAFYNENPDNDRTVSYFKMNKYYISFLYDIDEIKDKKMVPFFVLNIFDNTILKNYSAGFKYYAGYVPCYDNLEEYHNYGQSEENQISEEIAKSIPKTFEAISKKSEGVDNLAILKADVDNLGMIFSLGMKGQNRDISISKISTMSRMLDGFFSGWIQEEFKNAKNVELELKDRKVKLDLSNNYIVYSGGDDLMIVGPWNELILASKYINDKFREFTGNNKRITLSAGITLCHHKEPISYVAEKVNEEEERAKNSGKNCLAVFNKVVEWDNFDEVFDFGEFILGNMKKKTDKNEEIYSQSFIYRMLTYTDMAEKYAKTENGKYLKYVSSFMYDIGRNLIPKLKGNEVDNSEVMKKDEISKLLEVFNDSENYGQIYADDFLAKYMRVSLNWAVRKNRKTGGE